jgi:hypothetical protein
VISVEDVAARVKRLDQLTRGLAREVVMWKDNDDPLLFVERRAYLKAIRDALAGVETARVVLAKARQRIGANAELGTRSAELKQLP